MHDVMLERQCKQPQYYIVIVPILLSFLQYGQAFAFPDLSKEIKEVIYCDHCYIPSNLSI